MAVHSKVPEVPVRYGQPIGQSKIYWSEYGVQVVREAIERGEEEIDAVCAGVRENVRYEILRGGFPFASYGIDASQRGVLEGQTFSRHGEELIRSIALDCLLMEAPSVVELMEAKEDNEQRELAILEALDAA